MLLSINNLSKRYRNGVQALKDVSLSIPTGMFGLVGLEVCADCVGIGRFA